MAHIGGERCRDCFGRETEGKRSLGRPSRRWENNIKMDLQEIGRGGNWMMWLRIGTGGGLL